MALCALPGSTYLLRLGEEVTMGTATGQAIAQGAILVSPLRRLAYRAHDQGADLRYRYTYPPPGKRAMARC